MPRTKKIKPCKKCAAFKAQISALPEGNTNAIPPYPMEALKRAYQKAAGTKTVDWASINEAFITNQLVFAMMPDGHLYAGMPNSENNMDYKIRVCDLGEEE